MNNQIIREEYCKARGRNIFARFTLKVLSGIARFTIVPRLRIMLYRLMGAKIGKDVFVGLDCILDSSFPELITIEDDVVTSFRIMIICHGIATESPEKAPGKNDRIVAGVTLKKGCYIGAGAIILPGVIVGEHAVVAAGSVVTRNVESYTLVGGVPAKKIRTYKNPSDPLSA